MRKLKLLAAASGLAASGAVFAGVFHTECYAESSCSEVAAPLVTDAFTDRFPHKKWSLYVHASVLTLPDKVVCFGVAGVVPRGSGQMPANRYSHTRVFDGAKRSMTPGERMEYESTCIHGAVSSMMSARPDNMYIANINVARGK